MRSIVLLASIVLLVVLNVHPGDGIAGNCER